MCLNQEENYHYNDLNISVPKNIPCHDRLVGPPFEPPTVHVSKGSFWYIHQFGYSLLMFLVVLLYNSYLQYFFISIFYINLIFV